MQAVHASGAPPNMLDHPLWRDILKDIILYQEIPTRHTSVNAVCLERDANVSNQAAGLAYESSKPPMSSNHILPEQHSEMAKVESESASSVDMQKILNEIQNVKVANARQMKKLKLSTVRQIAELKQKMTEESSRLNMKMDKIIELLSNHSNHEMDNEVDESAFVYDHPQQTNEPSSEMLLCNYATPGDTLNSLSFCFPIETVEELERFDACCNEPNTRNQVVRPKLLLSRSTLMYFI